MRACITSLGDSALIVNLAEGIGDLPPQRVHAVCAWLAGGNLPGILELVPAATTITLFYSPLALLDADAPPAELADWLAARVLQRLDEFPPENEQIAPRTVEIPVCYGGDFGPDLREVASRTGRSPGEVIALHHGADYLVLQIGFAPGFPYLHGLPVELSLPRLEIPRTSVPAGSVGIANGQSCIYPIAIPGGWHLIGRTPLDLFQPDRNPPVLLQPGDRVKFRPITPDEFESREARS